MAAVVVRVRESGSETMTMTWPNGAPASSESARLGSAWTGVEPVECPGVRSWYDVEREQVRVRVPASCQPGEGAVRVGFAVGTFEQGLERTYIDDGYSTGTLPDAGPRLSRWFRQG